MNVVSVIVCTRNRADSLLRTVRSLLGTETVPFELIVMDQSSGEETRRALQSVEDPRLRYVRSTATGKGAALNEGLALAGGEIVLCTDDDCEAPPRWVPDMAREMETHPEAAIVFCNVTAEPYDRAAGYVPVYERRTDRTLRSIADARNGIGLGAGMGLRRAAILGMGGFDEALGPGSRFGSGDDWDLSIRALLRGWHVFDTARVSIVHHGFRTMAEGRQHALRDWVAIGALCAKPLRGGHLSAAGLAMTLFGREAVWPPLRDLLRFRRPSGLARIVGFLRGFTGGLRTPVDRPTLLFRPR
jgi:glycosyltransferase involved in cell wall biosynthesis